MNLAFSGKVFGSAGIGDAVDELLGTAYRAGAAASNLGCGSQGLGHGVV